MIKDETKSASSQDSDNNLVITGPKKKRQRTDDIFSEYSSSATESRDKKQNYGSEEEDNQYDELLNYHTLMLKEKGPKQDENPLLWWKSNETIFPMLSLLASKLKL
ncbi:unnamed protein product [Rotaria sp. Silwood1]|nr:unnamed protein product [Rotaria sp. Silwood1]